ncbi:MAG: Smr/MutS family protein, partial [Clostridia bacterium]|nr:Smr/MutS family protein [Clostridia bacterium]
RERLNQSIRKETKRLVENAMLEANEIIDALKNVLEAPDEKSLFKAYELRKSLKKFVINEENEFELSGQEAEGEIRVGDRVLIKSLNSEGVVTALNPIKKEAHVRMGSVATKTEIENLSRLSGPKLKDKPPKTIKTELRNEAVPTSLNIIGKTTDEVHFYLEEFIDSAYMGGLKDISIIHGIGEGKLRRAVRQYLTGNKAVATYRDGMYGEGGKGVTVVTLK